MRLGTIAAAVGKGLAAGLVGTAAMAPPAWEWGAQDIAVDALHHVVYLAATDIAYAALDR